MGEHIITETITTIVTLDTIELPENPTNGDVIKAMFPDMEEPNFYGMKKYMYDPNWWNAPYKRGREKTERAEIPE